LLLPIAADALGGCGARVRSGLMRRVMKPEPRASKHYQKNETNDRETERPPQRDSGDDEQKNNSNTGKD